MDYKSDNIKLQQDINELASRLFKLTPEGLTAPASRAEMLLLLKALLDMQRQSRQD